MSSSTYVSASLASLPMAQLLGAYGESVAQLAMEMSSIYIRQLMALAIGVDSNGEFSDQSDGAIQVRSVSFEVTGADGRTRSVVMPLISLMPPPQMVDHSFCDMEFIVTEVARNQTQSNVEATFGAKVSGKAPFGSIKYSASLRVKAAKVSKQDEQRSTKATVSLHVETTHFRPVGLSIVESLMESANVVADAPEEESAEA